MNTSVSFTKFSFCVVLFLSCCRGVGAQAREEQNKAQQSSQHLFLNLQMALHRGADLSRYENHINTQITRREGFTWMLHQVVQEGTPEQLATVMNFSNVRFTQKDSQGRVPLWYALEGIHAAKKNGARSKRFNAQKEKYIAMAQRLIKAHKASVTQLRQSLEGKTAEKEQYMLRKLNELTAS